MNYSFFNLALDGVGGQRHAYAPLPWKANRSVTGPVRTVNESSPPTGI